MDSEDLLLLEATGCKPTGLHFVCPCCELGGESLAVRPPAAKDVLLCMECGVLLTVTEVAGHQLRLRKSTAVELEQLDPDVRAMLTMNAEAIAFLNSL